VAAMSLAWFGGLVTLTAEAALSAATGTYATWNGGLWNTAVWGPDTVWTDLSQRLKVPLTTYRRFGREVQEWEAGEASLRFDNNDGALSPDNLSGPFVSGGVTQIRPLRPIRFSATYAGVTYPVYAGYVLDWVEDITRGPADIARAVVVTPAADEKSRLASFDGLEQPPAGAGEPSGQRIHRILDSAGHQGLRRIDTGRVTMQATTLAQPAFTEAQLTADSEGGALYVDDDGAWVYADQYALLEHTRSNTVQAIFGDGAGELPITDAQFGYAGDLTKNIAAFARVGGTSQVVSDLTSRALYGDRRATRTDLIAESDAQVAALARFWVERYKDPERRVTQITIKPRRDPTRLFPKALGLKVRDLIRVNRRAPGGYTISRDCHIAGISHEITRDEWITTFDLWSATPYLRYSTSRWDVGRWDSASWFF
jgi:hypothetical protein